MMKPKLSEWQPLDLMDSEAVRPLRAFNSRVAAGDHRYYTLNTNESAAYDPELDDDDDNDDNDSVTSEVEFINQVTENSDSETQSAEKKARNRMVAEGYKYHVLEKNGESGVIDPIEDCDSKRQRKRWQKVRLVGFLGVIMITCLVVVIIFQHYKGRNNQAACTSSTCVKGSAYILNKMDTAVNPCEDFYEFSCGNWEKITKIPASKAKYGAFSQISDEIELIMKDLLEGDEKLYKGKNSTAIHKAMQYYKLCMDETKIEAAEADPVIELIHRLGGWGFTDDPKSGALDTSRWNLQDAILLAHRNNFGPLFSMGVSTDERNSSGYLIKFQQSGLTLSDPKEYFANHTNSEAFKTAYIKWLTQFILLMGNSNDVSSQVNDLYNLEQLLAMIHVPREQLVDPQKIYHKMTLKKFQDDYLGDMIDIKSYMKGRFEDIASIGMDTEVVVYTPDYFIKLQDIVKNADPITMANYIGWMAAQTMTGYLNADFVNASMILTQVESGLKELPPRWKRCLGKVSSSLGFATGALYVQEHFKENSKKEVEMLLEEVRSAFIGNLYNLEWMDDTTREYAVEKAKAVTKMLGYPDYITDPDKLDKEYENLTIIEDSFFLTKLSIKRYYGQKNLKHLGTVPDRLEWGMVPTDVNGYYSTDFNHIVFPAGILRPPLFNVDSPKPFNFGSFGMICGHELTHGFDNNGRKFDKEGNMRDWWTNSSADNFVQHTKCFEDFYHNYTVNGTNLNGKTTLGENIADNGGMKMAYLAYKTWLQKSGADTIVLPGIDYNSDQLFFIGMAQVWCSYYTPEYEQKSILTDPHSIAKFRVLGSMSNSAEFAETFNCPKNSAMNPENKCSVW